MINSGFLWYDDDIMVFKNPLIMNLNLDTIINSFSFQNIVHYHPLVYISFAVENSLFGLDPRIYHITNIIIHCVNSILVFKVVLALRAAKMNAFIVALLFAVHPLHVESVAWITERKDVLYSLFFLSSLLFYLRYQSNRNTKYYVISVMLFLLSCLSKSMAVTLPLVLIAADYFIFDLKKLKIKDKSPYLLISLVFIIINFQTSFYNTDILTYGIYDRISFVFYSILFYPFKMFFPFNLSAIYPYPLNPGIQYLLSPVIFLGLIILLYKFNIRARLVKFGLWFYVITILPVLPVIPFGISITADRFSYIPLSGIFIIISYLISELLNKFQTRNYRKRLYLTLSVFAAVFLLMVILSNNRAVFWKDTESLMKDAVKSDDENYYAYFILGNYYSDNNRLSDAIISYNNCISIKNDYSNAYFNLGNAHFNSGNLDAAIINYNKTVEFDSTDKLAYNNLGFVYENKGDIDKAIENYKHSAALGYQPARDVLKYYGVSP